VALDKFSGESKVEGGWKLDSVIFVLILFKWLSFSYGIGVTEIALKRDIPVACKGHFSVNAGICYPF